MALIQQLPTWLHALLVTWDPGGILCGAARCGQTRAKGQEWTGAWDTVRSGVSRNGAGCGVSPAAYDLGGSAANRAMLTVNSCIKVRLDLQEDKSSVVVKGPFFP
jgi:hypothetical protein